MEKKRKIEPIGKPSQVPGFFVALFLSLYLFPVFVFFPYFFSFSHDIKIEEYRWNKLEKILHSSIYM